MSSPRTAANGCVREGTRVVLREITATLHNSPPLQPSSRLKSGAEGGTVKTGEHEVKVRFAREFADVGSYSYQGPESLSSASSFHSVSSDPSTKSSSGICVDSVPASPNGDDTSCYDNSYANTSIPGVDELISACADIRLNGDDERSSCEALQDTTQDLSQDQTFASATDEPVQDLSRDSFSEASQEDSRNTTQVIEAIESFIRDTPSPVPGRPLDIQERPILTTICVTESFGAANATKEEIRPEEPRQEPLPLNESKKSAEAEKTPLTPEKVLEETPLPRCEPTNLNSTVCLSPVNAEPLSVSNNEPDRSEEAAEPITQSFLPGDNSTDSAPFASSVSENADFPTLPSISATSSEESSLRPCEPTLPQAPSGHDKGDSCLISASTLSKTDLWPELGSTLPESILEEEPPERSETRNVAPEVENVVPEVEEHQEEVEQPSDEKLDVTLTLQESSLEPEPTQEVEQYTDFKPQRQSTSLVLPDQRSNLDEPKALPEEDNVDDFFKTCTQHTAEESDRFVSATSEIFQDPTSFDFLLARTSSRNTNRLGIDSLYVKFDPLVSNASMLPQGNATQGQIGEEEQNGKPETAVPQNVAVLDTPKRSPAIAAIDRLLFYSPLPGGTVQKAEEPKEKIVEQPTEKSTPEAPLIADINMSKELELVRATVLQLEEELEKQKKRYEAELEKQKKRYEAELEKQKSAFQEKIGKLQAQIAEEIESKSHMTVVLEEYEKSISRIVTERERDRTNFEQEKTKLQEELQAANVHLTNTEAAFNDVHQKYERLKGVVSAYKSNESVLKESIQENMETIKGLETRYDQLKGHAMAQLEKANFELDAIRKQHEDETVKLHAMVRKAELKSNSLAELVEQKTKENKELAQILDELIARVGHQNAE